MQIFDRGNYNYLNNNYNIPTYEQTEDEKYFNPYEGYIRGNLFPKLYNTYKIEVPYKIKPLNEQAEMLTYINSLYFALTDLNLYLDIPIFAIDFFKVVSATYLSAFLQIIRPIVSLSTSVLSRSSTAFT